MDMPKYGGEVVTWRMVTWRMVTRRRWFDGTCCHDISRTNDECPNIDTNMVVDGDVTDSDMAEVVC